MGQEDVRNRKKGSTKRSKKDKASAAAASSNDKQKKKKTGTTTALLPSSSDAPLAQVAAGAPISPDDQTMWQVFKSHPMVVAAPYVLVPVALYYTYLFVVLKRPELLSTLSAGALSIRPAVRTDDPRQVLILGSLGSGTIPVAEALRKMMKLEVHHEAADATACFTRDGTTSSLLGWRYSEDLSQARLSRALHDLCLNRTKDTQIFKPNMFQPTQCFSFFGSWHKCHAKECLAFVGREYGCAFRADGCRPTFVRVLHQARHPLRTIAELMAGVCPTYAKNKNTTVHPAFVQFATVFLDPDDSRLGSCLASVSWYVVHYNRALLAARQKGLVSAMYRYEDSSLCDVARHSGFADPDLVVYPPNLAKFASRCNGNAADGAAKPLDTATQKLLPYLSSNTDKAARKYPAFGWSDLEQAGGSKLVKALKKLCKDMGYDPDTTREEVAEFNSSSSSPDEEDSSKSRKTRTK